MSRPMCHLGSFHVCPKRKGKKPHEGGRVVEGSPDTNVNNFPATRTGDALYCKYCGDIIQTGSSNVFINNCKAVFVDCTTAHNGLLTTGSSNVFIGVYECAGETAQASAIPESAQQVTESDESDSAVTDKSSTKPRTKTDASGSEQPVADNVTNRGQSPEPEKEDDEFVIEVYGEDHPVGHSFRFYKPNTNEQVNKQGSTEKLPNSVLHVWPWKDKSKCDVHLEIATEGGGPAIEVPFLTEVGANNRQPDDKRQHHVILPIVPSVMVQGIHNGVSTSSGLMASRPGYFYIFHEGKLWRELEISQEENGEIAFRDVNLSEYRVDGKLKTGDRIPSGVKLKEIWLPARTDVSWVTLQVAYSESQLPAPRLNYLENSATACRQRCNTVKMEIDDGGFQSYVEKLSRLDFEQAKSVAAEGLEAIFSRFSGTESVFSITSLPKQKPRTLTDELECDSPAHYLAHTEGDYLSKCEKIAKDVHRIQEDGDPEDPFDEEERPEMSALAVCLHRTLNEISEEPVKNKLHDSIWVSKTEQAAKDCLANHKARGIGCVRVDDYLYRLRHLQRRREVGAWFADIAVQRAQQRDYFDSAVLVTNLIFPPELAKKKNELSKYMSELSTSGRKNLWRSVAQEERIMARRYLERIQEALLSILNSPRAHQALADLFTHEGYDYAGAHNFMGQILQATIFDPGDCDSLELAPSEFKEMSENAKDKGREWVLDLYRRKHSPLLYKLLFPEEGDVEDDCVYIPPEKPEINNGSGELRTSALAELENTKIQAIEYVKTLDGKLLLKQQEEGHFNTLLNAALRPGGTLLMHIHGQYWSAIESATQTMLNDSELKSLKTKLATLEVERNNLDRLKKDLQEEFNQLEHKTKEAKRKLNSQNGEIEQKKQELSDAKNNYLNKYNKAKNHAILVRMRLYGSLIRFMRESLPGFWGGLHLSRLSKAAQKGYHVLGQFGDSMDRAKVNLSGEQPKTYYGDVHDGGNTSQASTSRIRAKEMDIAAEVADESLVWVIPQNEETTGVLKELSDAESNVNRAEQELADAESKLPGKRSSNSDASNDLSSKRTQLANAEARFNSVIASYQNVEKDLESRTNTHTSNIDRTKRSRAYRALNTPALPIIVLAIEWTNLESVISSYDETVRKKGEFWAVLDVGSAALDLSMAVASMVRRFLSNVAVISSISVAAETQISFVLSGQTFILPSISMIFGALVGLLLAVTSLKNALDEYRRGNTGVAIGHILIALGGVATIMQAVGAPLVLVGPKGWIVIAVLLIASGFGLVAWFTEKPIETWMKKGPFGKDPSDLLADPLTAYHRLVGTLMGLSVSYEKFSVNSEQLSIEDINKDKDILTKEGMNVEKLLAIAKANSCLTVKSGIPKIFGDNHIFTIKNDYRVLKETVISVGEGADTISSTSDSKWIEGRDRLDYILWEEPTDDGYRIYLLTPEPQLKVNKPKFWSRDEIEYMESYHYHWDLRNQIKILDQHSGNVMVFPAPEPDRSAPFEADNTKHTKADFDTSTQLYWYVDSVQSYDRENYYHEF